MSVEALRLAHMTGSQPLQLPCPLHVPAPPLHGVPEFLFARLQLPLVVHVALWHSFPCGQLVRIDGVHCVHVLVAELKMVVLSHVTQVRLGQ